MDIGILLGEIVLARKPDFGWALDLDPKNQGYENGSLSQKQPVVFQAGNMPVGDIAYDPLGEAEDSYIRCKSPTMFWVNGLARGVIDIVNGAAEHAAMERERAWSQ